MRKLLMLTLLMSLFSAGSAKADDFQLSKELVSAIEIKAEEVRKERKVPSFAVGIVSGDQLVYAKGFGLRDLQEKLPAQADTLYHIGSVSKPITATLLALMLEEGKLKLSDPIQKYLPETVSLPTFQGKEAQLTLWHLATHSSGLPRDPPNRKNVSYGWFPNPGQAKPYSTQELYAALSQTKLRFAPGTECSYSNFGFGLLGHILERAAEQPLEQLLKQRLFQPLGMTDTTVTLDEEASKQFATHYWQDDTKRLGRPRTEFGDIFAHGGIVSSVEDLGRFVSFQFGYYDQQKLSLSQAGNRVLWKPQTALDGEPFLLERDGVSMQMCLGWRVQRPKQDGGIYNHSGEMDGHSAYLAFAPKAKLGVIILCNLGNSSLPLRRPSPAIEFGVWMKQQVLYPSLAWPKSDTQTEE